MRVVQLGVKGRCDGLCNKALSAGVEEEPKKKKKKKAGASLQTAGKQGDAKRHRKSLEGI